MHIETFKAKKINARRVALIFLSCTRAIIHGPEVQEGDLDPVNGSSVSGHLVRIKATQQEIFRSNVGHRCKAAP